MKTSDNLPRFALTSSVLAFAFAACHSPGPKRPDRPHIAPGVHLQDVTFHSVALGRDMSYRIFLPENLAAGQRLPVVYLLHGGNGSFRDWSNESDVARYAARGLILVMPEGAFSYYMNAIGKPANRYEDYILNDLIPDVETRFPAATGRENRAIIGISMGGFAAIEFALTRPELFFFVGAISPSVDIVRRRPSLRRAGEWWRVRTIFGPSGSASRHSRDPFLLAPAADPHKTPFIYLTAGDSEPLLNPNRRFAARLSEFHFAYEFHIKPGGHDWGEWQSQMPGCFDSLFLHHAQAQHIP